MQTYWIIQNLFHVIIVLVILIINWLMNQKVWITSGISIKVRYRIHVNRLQHHFGIFHRESHPFVNNALLKILDISENGVKKALSKHAPSLTRNGHTLRVVASNPSKYFHGFTGSCAETSVQHQCSNHGTLSTTCVKKIQCEMKRTVLPFPADCVNKMMMDLQRTFAVHCTSIILVTHQIERNIWIFRNYPQLTISRTNTYLHKNPKSMKSVVHCDHQTEI